MKFKNKNLLFSLALLALVLFSFASCQRHVANVDDGPFQCIAATVMIAGKPTTTIVEWNTKTGMARIFDSMVLTSKVTGSQNVVVGWIPLGDLQGAIQEIIARNQASLQQATPASQSVSSDAAVAPEVAPASNSTKKKK